MTALKKKIDDGPGRMGDDECCYVCGDERREELVRPCCALPVHASCLVALVDKTGRRTCTVCLREHPAWAVGKAARRARWRRTKARCCDVCYSIGAVGFAAGLCGTVIALATGQSTTLVALGATLALASLVLICVICAACTS